MMFIYWGGIIKIYILILILFTFGLGQEITLEPNQGYSGDAFEVSLIGAGSYL